LASKAIKEGRLKEEITPVFLAPEYKEVISEDFGPRDSQTIEALGKLKPFFDKATERSQLEILARSQMEPPWCS
jgi:acetyl-CoA acyltransferase